MNETLDWFFGLPTWAYVVAGVGLLLVVGMVGEGIRQERQARVEDYASAAGWWLLRDQDAQLQFGGSSRTPDRLKVAFVKDRGHGRRMVLRYEHTSYVSSRDASGAPTSIPSTSSYYVLAAQLPDGRTWSERFHGTMDVAGFQHAENVLRQWMGEY